MPMYYYSLRVPSTIPIPLGQMLVPHGTHSVREVIEEEKNGSQLGGGGMVRTLESLGRLQLGDS